MLQSQLIDQLLHLLSALVPGDRLRFQHREDVLLDSKLAKHRCFLGEITDSVLACPQIHGHICYIFVVDEHSACIGGAQTRTEAEGASFPTPVRPTKTTNLPRVTGKGSPLSNPPTTQVLADTAGAERPSNVSPPRQAT